MKTLAKLAGTLPFAHLLGVKAAGDPKEELSTATPAAVAKKCDDDADAQASAKAEDKSKDTGDDEGDDDKPKSKAKAKAKAEDDKEEPDDDDSDEKKAKALRSGERARCAAILAHGIKLGAVRQACAYAFDTDMAADVAIATLNATAQDRPASGGLAAAMATVDVPVVKPDAQRAEPDTPQAATQATVAAILKASAKARGEA